MYYFPRQITRCTGDYSSQCHTLVLEETSVPDDLLPAAPTRVRALTPCVIISNFAGVYSVENGGAPA